jgi:peptide/nickel transport system ATP-binding protein/oligopeptide transport system ATP-binding protein
MTPAPALRGEAPLLEIDGFSLDVATDSGPLRLVEDVSFSVARGGARGLVGESGCGKSVTALSVLRLLPEPPARIAAGAIRFDGTDLARADARRMRAVRGGRIGMIFQEPMTSLNPTFTVGWQIMEALRVHGVARGRQARARAADALRLVGVGAAESRLTQYPHELSGGLRQRVMIAMALACNPTLLIADEPTTALDVTVQRQILDLIGDLRRRLSMAVLLITHDLGVIAACTEQVSVMYAGRIVEDADTPALFAHPRHPYTVGLLAARPHLRGPRGALTAIPGTVPDPAHRGAGCTFAPRCPRVLPRCATERPPLAGESGHRVACWNPA